MDEVPLLPWQLSTLDREKPSLLYSQSSFKLVFFLLREFHKTQISFWVQSGVKLQAWKAPSRTVSWTVGEGVISQPGQGQKIKCGAVTPESLASIKGPVQFKGWLSIGMNVYRNAKNSSQYNICAEGVIYKGYSKQLGLCNLLSVEPLVINQNGHQKTKGNAINLFIGGVGVLHRHSNNISICKKKSNFKCFFFSGRDFCTGILVPAVASLLQNWKYWPVSLRISLTLTPRHWVSSHLWFQDRRPSI